jgi:hypothetical protein
MSLDDALALAGQVLADYEASGLDAAIITVTRGDLAAINRLAQTGGPQ